MPLANLHEFVSFLALVLVGLYAVVERLQGVRTTGFVLTGLAFALQLVSSAGLGTTAVANPLLSSPGFALHVMLVVLSYSSLALASLYGALYLFQARSLARRRFGLAYRRLPALTVLERTTTGFIELGVPLLFVALVAGHLWLFRVAPSIAPDLDRFALDDPKILTAWSTVVVYALGLVGHRLLGWRGRRVGLFAVWAFALLLFSTGVVRATAPTFHHFPAEESP